ncbi:MAG: MFS transporter [Thermoplasmatota archaeon]
MNWLITDRGHVSKFVIITLMIMGAFGVMGGGLVAPGLPTIGRAFDAPDEQIGLILSLYTLSAAISLPFIGYFIDAVGRRKIGITCLLIDGITGLAIIFVPNFHTLLVLRFIQGIGIAGLVPVAMTVIGDLFTGDKRLKFMGYLSGTISLGAVIIPTIGGTLASIDWRLVFAVYGLSIFLALLFYFTLPETRPSKNSKNKKSNSALEYAKSLISTLKIRDIRNVLIHSFVIYFLLYALVTYLPIYLSRIHGFSELFSGFALSIQGAFAAILASKAEFIARYLDWSKRAFLGFGLVSVSFLFLPFWFVGSYSVTMSFVIYGIGMGIVSPTIYNRVTKLSPQELSGSVIATFNMMKYIGMTAAPIIIGILLIFLGLNTIFIIVGVTAALWSLLTLLN